MALEKANLWSNQEGPVHMVQVLKSQLILRTNFKK
jgi:hypothetical protein